MSDLQKTDAVVQQLATLMAHGASPAEAARKVGKRVAWVRGITNSPFFDTLVSRIRTQAYTEAAKETVDSLTLTARAKLDDELIQSIGTLVHLRDYSKSEQVRLAAAKEIIDRTNRVGKLDKVEVDNIVRVEISATQLKALKLVSKEADNVVELPRAEYTEVPS